eukprot:3194358-Pyramimonas_sp.AAC.1
MTNKPRTRRTRLLHGLCTFGEPWVASRQLRTSPPLDDIEPGYVGARSRSAAITVGLALQWRLINQQRSHITTKHGMTSAFASVDHSCLDAADVKICLPGECAIMKGR